MLLAGIDDAGRGSVIGPLVIAGVSFDESQLNHLKRIGVKDSKELKPKKREELRKEILNLANEVSTLHLLPYAIDIYVLQKDKKLNRLEAIAMAEIIKKINSHIVYIDCPDINLKRFKDEIYRYVSKKVKIVCEHKADKKFLVVSAASIIAKVERDLSIVYLKSILGDFGSGYPSDLKTRKFLLEYLKNKGAYPNQVRKSWKTLERIREILK
ncbi:Ribonuclease HII [archaeon HR06]|nr:Ribonuclease HII [archaeon HR06]